MSSTGHFVILRLIHPHSQNNVVLVVSVVRTILNPKTSTRFHQISHQKHRNFIAGITVCTYHWSSHSLLSIRCFLLVPASNEYSVVVLIALLLPGCFVLCVPQRPLPVTHSSPAISSWNFDILSLIFIGVCFFTSWLNFFFICAAVVF